MNMIVRVALSLIVVACVGCNDTLPNDVKTYSRSNCLERATQNDIDLGHCD